TRPEDREAGRRECPDEECHCRGHRREPRSKKNALGLTDHPQLPGELQREVQRVVTQTKERSRWPIRRILQHLEIAPATYHRWLKARAWATPSGTTPRKRTTSIHEVLPSERQRILDYARAHPELRHRELAWKMLDENVVAVSPSTVYRVLGEANLVYRWVPR